MQLGVIFGRGEHALHVGKSELLDAEGDCNRQNCQTAPKARAPWYTIV